MLGITPKIGEGTKLSMSLKVINEQYDEEEIELICRLKFEFELEFEIGVSPPADP